MKKIISLGLLIALAFGVSAQLQRGLKGSYNTDNYPDISFVWNTANPDVLEKSRFVLTEDGKEMPFQLKVLDQTNAKYKKTVLFLWEDMASHNNQSIFAKKLLQGFFSMELKTDDRFGVAVFNRKHDFHDVLSLLGDGITSNYSQLYTAVTSYNPSKERYKSYPGMSDLYMAINSGVDLLKKEPSDRVGVIVVITAGLNIKAAGANTEMSSVQKNALDAGIPIYVVNYPFSGKDGRPEISSLANSTYGGTIDNSNVNIALEELENIYNNLNFALSGRDYQITFTTSAKRDGKTHQINLAIDKVQQNIPAFNAPNITFGLWVKENLVLFIILMIVFIGLVALAIALIRKAKAKRDRELDITQEQIDTANRNLEDLKRQQEEKERLRQAELQQKHQEDENLRLNNLMRNKNMYPRLQCQLPGQTFSYAIGKAVTRIGRNPDNDLVLNNGTVSGVHAEIRFNGSSFELVNLSHSYTRGIIVNGQFCQNTSLKNGDKIGFGETTVTFYL